MKKHLANIVTSSRIVGGGGLFLFNDFSAGYLVIYCLCGFTDFIDGPIARKTGSASPLGAALDTIGDVLTYLSLVKVLVIQKMIPSWLLIWLGCLIGLGFVLAFYSLKKFKKFYIPHTYLGKSLGLCIFVLPVAVKIITPEIWFVVICTTITVVAIEALIVQIKTNEPKDFVPSVFHINK